MADGAVDSNATAQGIAGGAGLFSSILGPIGVGVQLFGAGMQIAQAMKARRQQRSAERAADDKLAQAKRQISTNRLEGIQIPMTAFQQAAQIDLAMQQQALMGLAESDPRALAAGLGRVQAAGIQGTETRRQAMEKSMFEWDKMVAENQQRIDQMKAGISLQEASGAQDARKNAEERFGQAVSGAIQNIGGAALTGYQQSQLYKRQQEPSPFQQAATQQTPGGEVNYASFRDTRLENDYSVGQSLPQVQQSFNQPAYGNFDQSRYTLDSISGADAISSPFSIGGMSGFGFQSLSPNIQGLQ